MAERKPPQLLVCIACRAGTPVDPESPPPGRVLCDRLAALGQTASLQPTPVTCFGNCERGCTVLIAGAGKWAYLLGGLHPDNAADIVTYADAYAKSDTGFVGRDARPASLRTAIVVRFPLHLMSTQERVP
ncbi:DUF1636 domain-containing protein [Reyranella sp. CPCC 100927]|uniref:DUF1636 family protein n=1 Tax=Reyranella sp. CPCC 100927 TaxID=2599616 RepID=UPI0011B48A72|nr:DUF1636 domain-containing protein [Reyranella sp. CPCC 100927]TWT10907.1 DUF1636 domain-containing protein [Reyranella sp. CPCC 100927]